MLRAALIIALLLGGCGWEAMPPDVQAKAYKSCADAGLGARFQTYRGFDGIDYVVRVDCFPPGEKIGH